MLNPGEFLHIGDDRTFTNPNDQSLIEELKSLTSNKKKPKKKAFEPLSVLQCGSQSDG
jgi:hypothetical protein